MSRCFLITACILILIVSAAPISLAGQMFPQAPASVSWLPHGYGQTMYVDNTVFTRQKAIHGFRSSPYHTGSWAQPLWGWDINGYYRGPQAVQVDPVECQLPIGLIYPENTPPPPPIGR
ncbi:hypothetical protein [Desulfomonile tiedjei]|uniref:Uncharacterized protein n=1 Tax=Desulfomonile tiedjei (strain ATCC 49306 / DSM 6799 / DCB-1) TaxID=706587 RepID=I4C9Y1_DESTA|nr:hypothetical protein [Desulfomonile tiedjei]AFM26372.1 hypothetical protein Desti_3728 [Desulfomonile tiedjei DSM 6799]